MKNFIKFAALALTFTANLAVADSIQWNKHLGTYAEINAGSNLYYLGVFSPDATAKTGGFEGLGWSAALGHHLTETFAFEGGFMQNYAKLHVEENTDEHNKYQYVHTNVPYLTTRFDVPIADKFGFIAKVGAMYLSIPNETAIVLPFVGLGTSYAITPNMSFQLQYQGAVYGIAGAGLLSGGLAYYFN